MHRLPGAPVGKHDTTRWGETDPHDQRGELRVGLPGGGVWAHVIEVARAHLARCQSLGRDLTHANLSGSNLANAKITGASLYNAKFSGANRLHASPNNNLGAAYR
jgi:hypothetical protein